MYVIDFDSRNINLNPYITYLTLTCKNFIIGMD